MDQKMTVSMTDFDFNPTVPGDAFNLEIPQGICGSEYHVSPCRTSTTASRTWWTFSADTRSRAGGKFPKKMDDMGPYMKVLAMKNSRRRGLSDADMQWIVRFPDASNISWGHCPSGQWKYLGDGKTMGDSQCS